MLFHFATTFLGVYASDTRCNSVSEEVTMLQAKVDIQRRSALSATADVAAPLAQQAPPLPPFTTPTVDTAAPVSTVDQLHRKMLDEDLYGSIGGRCIDGTMAGYYYGNPVTGQGTTSNPHQIASSTLWVINMAGGGGCSDQETCERKAAVVGSNNAERWPSELPPPEKILKKNYWQNSQFQEAHHVHIPYCTEDAHAGQVVSPTNGCAVGDANCVDQWGLYFSGHLNLKNILHHMLSTEPESRSMTQVLFTGTSAGSIGVYMNCDFLQTFFNDVTGDLGMEHVDVSCAGVGGWYSPGYTADHGDNIHAGPSNFADFSAGVATDGTEGGNYIIALNQRYLPPECTAHFPGETYNCLGVTAVYPHIQSRMYVVQNMFDSNWLTDIYGLPSGDYDTCAGSRFITYVGNAMKETAMTLVPQKPNDGLFLASSLHHTGGIKFSGLGGLLIQGHFSMEGLASWFFGDANVPRILEDDCYSQWDGPCNPSDSNTWRGFDNHTRAEIDPCSACAEGFETLCSTTQLEEEQLARDPWCDDACLDARAQESREFRLECAEAHYDELIGPCGPIPLVKLVGWHEQLDSMR